MIWERYPNMKLNARTVQGSPLTAATQKDETPAGNDVSIYIYCTPGSSAHRDRDMVVWREDDTIYARVWKRDVKWDSSVGAHQHVWGGRTQFMVASGSKPETSWIPKQQAASK